MVDGQSVCDIIHLFPANLGYHDFWMGRVWYLESYFRTLFKPRYYQSCCILVGQVFFQILDKDLVSEMTDFAIHSNNVRCTLTA